MSRTRQLGGFGIGLAAVGILWAATYFGMGGYGRSIIILVSLNALLAVSYNVTLGFAGQLSLAQAGLMGIGAYAFAIWTTTWQLPPFIGILVAIVGGGVVAMIIAAPVLRLRGLFFAVTTLAAGELIVIGIEVARDVTGGGEGFAGIPPLPPIKVGDETILNLAAPVGLAILLPIVLVIVIGISQLLRQSRLGSRWLSLKQDESLAASLGVSPYWSKLWAIGVGGAIAGLGGSLYASYLQFIEPMQFSPWEAIFFLSIAVVGGLGRTWGPVVGAVVLTAISETLRKADLDQLAQIASGIALVIIVLVAPTGLVGLAERGGRAVLSRIRRRPVKEVSDAGN